MVPSDPLELLERFVVREGHALVPEMTSQRVVEK